MLKGETKPDRFNQWKDHFQNLLGQAPTTEISSTIKVVNQVLPIPTEHFTTEEPKNVTSKKKNNKILRNR